MAAAVSEDEIRKRCRELVYQVAYSFYDAPYIILLNLLVHFEVVPETVLGTTTQLSPNEVRKYLGMLLTHRLIKRYANKEKVKINEYQQSRPDAEKHRNKDVIYYYIDYREFANVTKYRLAMMRKNIEEKLMQDVGHKGYICPFCSRKYDPLDLAHLFDPSTDAFQCEDDRTELIEHVPDDGPTAGPGAGAEGENGDPAQAQQDKLQRFNAATAPVRDALRDVEAVTVPTTNIVAWIARNVKTAVEVEDEKEVKGKVTVVLGGEDERERVERERLAEAQRVQNALPVWHTHSTVTGSATALGIKDQARDAARRAAGRGGRAQGEGEGEDEMLKLHYEGMEGESDGEMEADVGADNDGAEPAVEDGTQIKLENAAGVKRAREDTEERETETDGPVVQMTSDALALGVKMIKVGGVAKPLEDVTEEDQELMTPDEYEAYYEAALA